MFGFFNKSNSEKSQTFYGGLSYKAFSKITHVPLKMNDYAWAARLFPVAPYWWQKLTSISVLAMSVSVISMLFIMYSFLTRPDPVLLWVFPNGQMVCAENLVDKNGNIQSVDKKYTDMCAALSRKASKRWAIPVETENKVNSLPPSQPPSSLDEKAVVTPETLFLTKPQPQPQQLQPQQLQPQPQQGGQ